MPSVTTWTHIGLAVVYLVWGGLYWGFSASGDWCSKEISGNTDMFHLVGAALIVSGLTMLISAAASTVYREQMDERLVYFRWFNWGISQSLLFVVMAVVADLTGTIMLAAVAFIGAGIAFFQSTNEAYHCEGRSTQEAQTGDKGEYDFRVEGWLMALAFFLFLAISFIISAWSGGAPDVSEGFVVIAPFVVYLLLHLAILSTLTNYGWGDMKTEDKSSWRESIFLFSHFLILAFVSIPTAAGFGDLGTGCP